MAKTPEPSSLVRNESAVGAFELPPAAVRRAVVVLTTMNLLNYVDRYVLPAIVEQVRRDIPMTDTEQGFALSSFIWVYMLAAPVFGRLGDRARRSHLIALGVALWSLATTAAAFVHSYPGLLAARAAVGIGEAAYATLAPSLIGDYFPPARRGRVMTLFYTATPIGSALGYVLGGALAQAFSWRAAFLGAGIPGLLIAALALFLPEPARATREGDLGTASLAHVLRELARNRAYVLTVAGYTAYIFALGGLAQWMPAYLIRVRHLDSARANGLFGMVTVVAGLVGTVAGGALAEMLRGRVRQPYLAVSWVTALLAVPASVLAFWSDSPAVMWTAIVIAEFVIFMSTGPINTLLVNVVPASVRATAFALSLFVSHLLGDAISPILIGIASDRTSLGLAVLLVPLTFAVAAAIWAWGQRTVEAPG